MERWLTISSSFYYDSQPLYVEVSELFGTNYNITEARDYLWKSLNKVQAVIRDKILNEDSESAYMELYSYHPDVRNLFRVTYQNLKEFEEARWGNLLEKTQAVIKKFKEYEEDHSGFFSLLLKYGKFLGS